MKIRLIFVASVVCFASQSVQAAGGGARGGGIADVARAEPSGARQRRVDRADTPQVRATDESSGKPVDQVVANALPPSQFCDFAGLGNGDSVDTAYASGVSSSGAVRNNLGVSFVGAKVLNVWNGAGSPDPGVAYAPSGAMVVCNVSGLDWSSLDFSYCSRVGLTVETFASLDGTGAVLESFSVAENISAAPYSAWISRSIALARPARSVRISGTGNMWGIDALSFGFVPSCPLWGDGLSCASAYARGQGTWTVNTSDAVTNAPCSCSAKYLTFRATANGTVVASTCGYRTYDTWLSAYDACGGACLASNDDYCGLGSRIQFPVVAGQQYWVALGGFVCRRGAADVTLSGPIVPVIPSGQDCNGDGRDDACQIASGELSDCNQNGQPDACDLAQAAYSVSASGILATDGGSVSHTFTRIPLATSDVNMRFEVNADINGGADGIEFVLFTAGGSSQISLQIMGAQCAPEVRTLTVPAAMFNSARSSSGELTFAIRTGQNTNSFCANTWKIDISGQGSRAIDCDQNGVIDSCEIAGRDCNGNGVLDACDFGNQPVLASQSGTLQTRGGTVTASFPGLHPAAGDVTIQVEANSDLDSYPSELLRVHSPNGQIDFSFNGLQCSPTTTVRTVSAQAFNACLGSGGLLQLLLTTGSENNFCSVNTWRVNLSYLSAGEADCNSNGVPDSCELASGAAIDQNGNGVPDSCDPFPTLTLTTNASACNSIGSEIEVEARLSGVLNLVVAGQLVLDWDPSRLELVANNAGDPPYVSSFLVDNAAGQALILVSVAPGGTGTTALSAIVSRLRFRTIGTSCDGVDTSIEFGSFAGLLSTEFTDGFGTGIVPTLVASNGFVVDDGAPVLTNVPADVMVQAHAGENGFALVTLNSPSVIDSCASSLTASGARSDGRVLGAPWPSGSTSVTWTATDPCGNSTTASTIVTVDPTNTMDLVAYFVAPFGSNPSGGTVMRRLTVLAQGTSGSVLRLPDTAVGPDGVARFSISDLPVDDYGCVTIEHAPNSLRARVAVSDAGSFWAAQDATLVLGDIINDEVIDVLDWGAYIVRNVNADLNGDGFISSIDGNIILANFGQRGALACGSSLMGPRDPVTAISVAELVEQGLAELAGADLNGDGWLDQTDMDLGVE